MMGARSGKNDKKSAARRKTRGERGERGAEKTIKNPRHSAECAVNEIGARAGKTIKSTAQNKLKMKYARGKTFRAFF